MSDIFAVAELIYSSWILSDDKGPAGGRFPSRKTLTYALKRVVDEGAFPEWMRKELHFVDGRTGLLCVELAEIEELATQMKLTADPNPTYIRTLIEANAPVAERALAFWNIRVDDARRWGLRLRCAVDETERELAMELA